MNQTTRPLKSRNPGGICAWAMRELVRSPATKEQTPDIAVFVKHDLRLDDILRSIRLVQDRDEEVSFGFARQTMQAPELFDDRLKTNGLDFVLPCKTGNQLINVCILPGQAYRARGQVEHQGESRRFKLAGDRFRQALAGRQRLQSCKIRLVE